MEIIVIGLGSMGKRRIRLLREIYGDVKISGIDEKDERRATCESLFSIHSYKCLADCLQKHSPDVAFICTPPLSHSSLIRECLLYDMHIFSEINLVSDGYEENIELARRRGRVLFLSSTPLYREEIKYIIRKMEKTVGAVNYLSHIGQYLPDWHPWDILQDFFVSKKETNGCRELFAIELPWLLQAFGAVKRVEVMRHKVTSLPIQYDDSYFVLLEHEKGHHGALIVDVASREPVRHFELFGEQVFLSWGGTPDSLWERDLDQQTLERVLSYEINQVQHDEAYSRNIVENAYAAEIKNFFEVVQNRERPRYSFAEDIKILKLIDKIEGTDI